MYKPTERQIRNPWRERITADEKSYIINSILEPIVTRWGKYVTYDLSVGCISRLETSWITIRLSIIKGSRGKTVAQKKEILKEATEVLDTALREFLAGRERFIGSLKHIGDVMEVFERTGERIGFLS